ncbi:nuclease, partial [Escherichia coli]
PKNVESAAATFDPTKNAIDFDESLEGMRVALDDARAVGPTNPKYRETPVVPGQNVDALTTPRGGVLYSGYDHPNAMRVILDDQAKPANPLPVSTVGDVYTGRTTGIMDYPFAMPHVHVTDVAGHRNAGLKRETTKAQGLFEMA